jgi:hypothetical protein
MVVHEAEFSIRTVRRISSRHPAGYQVIDYGKDLTIIEEYY